MRINTSKICQFGALSALTIGLNAPFAAYAEPDQAGSGNDIETIIVTGTRDTGVKAKESPAPIEIIGPQALETAGVTNTFDALSHLVPSFSQSQSGDYGATVQSARLRGLPPGDVLILVDGKRRHNSAYVDTTGPDVGSNPVDLSFIPPGLIDHVEILQDGAAAQYGSDAIAGVMNFVLKHNEEGITLSTTDGITGQGDGAQEDVTATAGFKLGDGFLDVSAEYHGHDFSVRDSGIPPSYATSTAFGQNGTTQVFNRVNGDVNYNQGTLGYNAEVPGNLFGGSVTFYGFGTAGYRQSEGYLNYRAPNVLPTIWPQGFFPRETLEEYDFSTTEGVKGTFGAEKWTWDLSNTFGIDTLNQGLINSGNTGLFALTGSTPTNVHSGGQQSSQLTTNLDITRALETGLWEAPLKIAGGLEHRYETYTQTPGAYASYAVGGTQGFSGFSPQSASSSNRNVEAAYVDLSTKPLPPWQIDLAGRFENYSDGGSTETGRLSTRYDFTSWIGIRGTVSTGFHAPTLAQDHFGIANVSPPPGGGTGEAYSLVLPPTTAGAKVLGAVPLKPEKSTDFSFGLVSQLTRNIHITADAYQISISNRIIQTGAIGNSTNAAGNALAIAAGAANGYAVGPGSGNTFAVSTFVNGADTRTQGLDISADYRADLGDYGDLRLNLAANTNFTVVTKKATPTAILASANLNYFTPLSLEAITKANPVNKLVLTGTYFLDKWDVTLRETRYGHADDVFSYGAPLQYYNLFLHAGYLTDLVVGYQLNDAVKISIGANNIFNTMPTTVPAFLRSVRNSPTYPVNPGYAQWGIDGDYYFARISLSL